MSEPKMDIAIADAMTALAQFVIEKKASTAALGAVIRAFNAVRPRAEQGQLLASYVQTFNGLTALSDTLRAKLDEAKTQVDATTIGIANLTNDQVKTLAENPIQYFLSGYLIIANSLLRYDRDDALRMVDDMVAGGLKRDLAAMWADQDAGVIPEPPRTAIVFDPKHALTMALTINVPKDWDVLSTDEQKLAWETEAIEIMTAATEGASWVETKAAIVEALASAYRVGKNEPRASA